MHANANLLLRKHNISLCAFYIVKNPRWRSKYRRSLASSIYNNFPRVVAREREEESWCRGVWSPCFGSPKKTIRYNRSLGGTQHRTTEDSVSSMSSVRLTRTDGIKSSEAREGGVANLNFPSRQPPRGRFFAFAGINGHVTAGLLAIHARCRHYANHRSGRLTDMSSSPAASGRARGSIEKGGK